jgi:S1-C subfamily serine protease
MSEQPRSSVQDPDSGDPGLHRSGATHSPDPSAHAGPVRRLEPRPLQRPEVDPAHSAVFGRPQGVEGSFDQAQRQSAGNGVRQAPPAPEALAEAFGRPPDDHEPLQRAPGEAPFGDERPPAEQFWNEQGERDPWRDPSASAVLGPPAVSEETPDKPAEPEPGPLLSVREVLFGRRVRPRSLLALIGVVLLVGGVGGFIGRFTAEQGNPLTNPRVTLAQVEQGANRPAGTIASVAQRLVNAVVSVEVTAGAQGSTGSGVVIDGNGYVLTNNHVISMAANAPDAQIWAVFHDGTRTSARIVGRDTKTDLAVLKVSVANPTVAQLGTSSTLAVGDDVIAIGSPLGLASTVTSGIVSSVNRPVRLAGDGSDTNAVIDAIQTDAAINPGNSGGALVDGNGAVIGINSAIRTLGSTGESGSIGLGFAIPIDEARRVAQSLIRTGQVRHADLGVNAKSVVDGSEQGAQVQNVQDGSSAATAGLQEGDVIIQVGSRKIGSADELVVAVDEHQSGEIVPITVVRNGRQLVLDAALR